MQNDTKIHKKILTWSSSGCIDVQHVSTVQCQNPVAIGSEAFVVEEHTQRVYNLNGKWGARDGFAVEIDARQVDADFAGAEGDFAGSVRSFVGRVTDDFIPRSTDVHLHICQIDK